MTTPSYAVGQAWRFKSAPAPDARVVIGLVETVDGHDIVHLSLLGLPAPETTPTADGTIMIAHMPFDREHVDRSLDSLIGEEDSPEDFQAGLADWRASLEGGEAGVFSLPISEAVEMFFAAVSGGFED